MLFKQTNRITGTSGPSTPAANVRGEVMAPTAVVEAETPVVSVAQETVTTESTPAREELPYAGMNELSAFFFQQVLSFDGRT